MTPFPWKAAMQFGLGVLRLAPKDFWAMTPRELSAAYTAFEASVQKPIERTKMQELEKQFPDGKG